MGNLHKAFKSNIYLGPNPDLTTCLAHTTLVSPQAVHVRRGRPCLDTRKRPLVGTLHSAGLFKDSKHHQDVGNGFLIITRGIVSYRCSAGPGCGAGGPTAKSALGGTVRAADTYSGCLSGSRGAQQVMPAGCGCVSLLEAPCARWSSCQGRRLPGRAPGLCSPGVQRVKCGGAGAAGWRARGTARTRPSEGKLSRSPRGWIPVPEAARGAAGCTRAGAVGGRPARAPSKRGAHARESGRCQPGEVGAGAEEPGALPAVGRRAGSRRSLSQVRGGFACAPRLRIHPAGARTGARECSHAHARLRHPTTTPARLRVLGSGGRRVEGERRATSVEVGGPGAACGMLGGWRDPGMEGRGAALGGRWGLAGGPGSSKVSTGRGVGGRQATVSRPRGSLPGLGLAAPFCRLRRRVLPWGAQGRGSSSKCGHGLVRLDLGPYAVCPHWARLVCGGVCGGPWHNHTFRSGEPRLVEPDGGSGMPGGLRGYVPDSSVGRGRKEESALHLN